MKLTAPNLRLAAARVHARVRSWQRPDAGGTPRWPTRVIALFGLAGIAATAVMFGSLVAAGEFYYIYFSRRNLPDLGPFTRFELPSVGRIFDAENRPLVELAREYRDITPYEEIPPIVRDAILAAEDKRFFSHNGVDYLSLPRVLAKARLGSIVERLFGDAADDTNDPGSFPQGGSTITQQLVRGLFLSHLTAKENTSELQYPALTARILASAIGARSVNMLARKREEVRLSLWLERQMRKRFGSKRRAKEEILARYASYVYMGNGQYGVARAAEYYFGRPLASLTADDADEAALLAGVPKSPRDFAPNARDAARVIERRNRTLALMQASGWLSAEVTRRAQAQPIATRLKQRPEPLRAPAVVDHVLDELNARYAAFTLDDLQQGRVQVHATVDGRIQRIVNNALERGLARYEERHPRARGLIQGSIVVLHNGDGRILAEAGGRQVYKGRSAAFTDYNRVTRSMRQPGSAMKPIVYLAAFQRGDFTLDTPVPDAPIAVSDGGGSDPKWISNYDGTFRGVIAMRQALAESRNAASMWVVEQIGIDAVLQTSRRLGVETPLRRFPATALGASEMPLLDLANAYRAMASGITAEPYLIETVECDSEEIEGRPRRRPSPVPIDSDAMGQIQEGLRGVVRLPGGTAHSLMSRRFGIDVMGKTGTTNEFKDAIFVGSTYGAGGITVAVRVGFDDSRTLGDRESGSRVALPVFQEIMRGVYRDGILGRPPEFRADIEARITDFMAQSELPPPLDLVSASPASLLSISVPIQMPLMPSVPRTTR